MNIGKRMITSLRGNHEIPVFFACDDKFVKYMMVTIQSMIKNASKDHQYHVHVLYTDISEDKKKAIKNLENEQFRISFDDVSDYMREIEKKLSVRDYYSMTTYYRLFLSEMFPQYSKAIYLDSDTVVLGDISELYQYELGELYIGGIRDQVVGQTEVFGEYSEEVLGISRKSYFNAGVVLINCQTFRKNKVLKQFIELVNTYTFVVAQDQDYLNIICKDKVLWIDDKWNAQAVCRLVCREEDICLIHYNLAAKPWHYEDSSLAEYFWKYAKETPYYDEICQVLENYTDEQRRNDQDSGKRLMGMAADEIQNENNYVKSYGADESRSLSRRVILNKIQQYENEGRFDEDVEENPEPKELLPENIDYLRRGLKAQMRTIYAFRIAKWYMNTMIRRKQLIIKEIRGIENLRRLRSGAILTCNHFNPFDSFAMQAVYEKSRHYRRKLYRIINEANYTNFPGFYGFLMRNCNTLPLSSNRDTMKKFLKAVDKLLQKGHFILIYPEQSMWWNYRKPKPLKKGAFTMAAKNNVPVLPCFITMEDSDVLDRDGFYVQEYTIHVGEPIYPDRKKSRGENARDMMMENYRVWKQIYEEVYQQPLTYAYKRKKLSQ